MNNAAVDPRFATRERQPGLDLLRALALIGVVLFHAGGFGFAFTYGLTRFGWVGVDLFFVLSGYLIGGQLLAPLARGLPVDFGRFFRSRCLRILPAYLVVLAIYFWVPALRESSVLPPAWTFLTFVQNIDLHLGTGFSHAWSLCVEAQFYLVLPFVLALLARKPRYAIVLLGAVLVASLALRTLLAVLHPAADGKGVDVSYFQTYIYYCTWTRLDPLVIGVGLAALQQFRPRAWQRLLDQARWMLPAAILLLAAALDLGEGDEHTIFAATWQFFLVALSMAALLVCAISERLPFRRVAVPGAAYVASIAYSVYLSHKFALHLMTQLCASRHLAESSPGIIILTLILIFIFGSILFFAVERPFLQLRRRTTERRASPTPGAGALVT